MRVRRRPERHQRALTRVRRDRPQEGEDTNDDIGWHGTRTADRRTHPVLKLLRRPPPHGPHEYPRRRPRVVLSVLSRSPKACVLPGDAGDVKWRCEMDGEKMESHPARVKRLRMASIWTRSGHETYICVEEERFTPTKSHIFPAKTENTRTSRVCVFTLGYAFSLMALAVSRKWT